MEMTFTAEELEALEPIDEEALQPSVPSAIDGISVNMNPRSMEIKEVFDVRRIGQIVKRSISPDRFRESIIGVVE